MRTRVNKRYGAQAIVYPATDFSVLPISRWRTGVFSLDRAIGGGIPCGRITRVYGPYSSGKSLLAYRTVAQNKTRCRNCWGPVVGECCDNPARVQVLWVDAEGAWDATWARQIGVDISLVEMTRPSFLEQALDIITAYLQEDVVDLVVFDSLAALPVGKESEESIEDGHEPGLHARKLNSAFRKWIGCLSSNKRAHPPAIIVINQLRETMDAYVAEVLPGGKGQEYASSLDIRVQGRKDLTDKGKLITFGQHIRDGSEVVGRLIEFRIPKNRTAPAHQCGEFVFWFARDPHFGKAVGDVDCSQALFDFGVRYGLIKKTKGEYVADLPSGPANVCSLKPEAKLALMSKDAVRRELEDVIIERVASGAPEVAADSDEDDDAGE